MARGNGQRTLSDLDGAVVVARDPVVVGQIRLNPSQPALIRQRGGERFGFSQAVPDPLVLRERHERVTQFYPDIDGLLAGLTTEGELPNGLQRLLQVRYHLPARRAGYRPCGRLAQIRHRLRPALAAERVVREPLDVLGQAIRV